VVWKNFRSSTNGIQTRRGTTDSPTPRRNVHRRARRSTSGSRDEGVGGLHLIHTHTRDARLTNVRRKSKIRKQPGERPTSRAPIPQCNKAADPAPDEECTRPKPLRVRKTIQNKRINLLANNLNRRNRRRRHTSGEVSPRQRCHCCSILVSPRKDVGEVTAEYTGY